MYINYKQFPLKGGGVQSPISLKMPFNYIMGIYVRNAPMNIIGCKSTTVKGQGRGFDTHNIASMKNIHLWQAISKDGSLRYI